MNPNCSLVFCDEYDYDKVRTAVQENIRNLGGLEKYISPGEKILLKVNLVMKKRPEEAVTTHPTVVKALAEELLEYGAEVLIGDSPGGPFTAGHLNAIYKMTGMSKVAAETGARLNTNFGTFRTENPDGLIMKRLTLVDMLNDVDKVITVAKLKTHGMMTYTGATKNLFGLVPGITKPEYHFNMPDYERFADALIDICRFANPVLSFIDGIIGMEGHGPTAGTPIAVNVLMAGSSPYHLDQAACHIIGLPISEVPMLKRLHERGMIGELSDINFSGEPLEKFIMQSYEIVKTNSPLNLHGSNMPKFVKRFALNHLQSRPEIKKKECTGCGACKEACPAKVIKIENRKAVIEFEECIRCYCCHELCPLKAITIYKPPIVKLLKI